MMERAAVAMSDDTETPEPMGNLQHSVYEPPELSGWECHLFGIEGYILRPVAGDVPNWFWRLTQHVILGNRWEKVKRK